MYKGRIWFPRQLSGRGRISTTGSCILGIVEKGCRPAKEFDEVVDFSGVEQFIDQPVKNYSSGMYGKVSVQAIAINTTRTSSLWTRFCRRGRGVPRKVFQKFADFRGAGDSA
jgi:ABC-2 type transport system ATP-binding protein